MQTQKRGAGKVFATLAMAAALSEPFRKAGQSMQELADTLNNLPKGENRYGQVIRSNIGNAVQQRAKLKRRKAGKAARQSRKINSK